MTFSVEKKGKSEKVWKMMYKLPKMGLTFVSLYAKLDKSKEGSTPEEACGSRGRTPGGVRTAALAPADR